MQPTLFEDDIVIVEKELSDDYQVGDILVYSYGKKGILIHRLVAKEKGVFYCKGDNAHGMECINSTRVIGRVTQIISRKENK